MSDTSKPSGWRHIRGSDHKNQPLNVQQHIQAIQQQKPIAEVHLKLFDLNKGQAEVSISITPNGNIAANLADPSTRAATYAQLLAAIEREIKDGLNSLDF